MFAGIKKSRSMKGIAKSKSMKGIAWQPKSIKNRAGDVKGLILYLKKGSRMFGGIAGMQYKTMYCTIPNDNPRRIEIYSTKTREGKPKRKIVFSSVLDFREKSKADTKNKDTAVDIVVE